MIVVKATVIPSRSALVNGRYSMVDQASIMNMRKLVMIPPDVVRNTRD